MGGSPLGQRNRALYAFTVVIQDIIYAMDGEIVRSAWTWIEELALEETDH